MIDQATAFFSNVFGFVREDWTTDGSIIKPLVLPLVAAGFGALSGGWFAYRLRLREGKRQRYADEFMRRQLGALNAATICNSALSLKKQMLSEMIDLYLAKRKEIQAILGAPTAAKQIRLQYDLMTIVAPQFNLNGLSEDIRAISARDGINLLQLSMLIEAVENLRAVLESRNQWVLDFERRQSEMSEMEAVNRYLGLPLNSSVRDERYLHMMEQLKHSIDGIIFHSMQIYFRLTQELVKDVDRYRRLYGEKFDFHIVDFTINGNLAFFPNPKDF